MSTVNKMRKGYGKPVVIIRSDNGRTIASTEPDFQHAWGFNTLDLGRSITMFNYMYVDDDEDECMITFETQNPNLPDHKELQEGSLIKVEWGYWGNTVTRKIRVKTLRTRYQNDKIIFDVKCVDRASAIAGKGVKKSTIMDQEADALTSFVSFFKATFGVGDLKFKIVEDGVEVLDERKLTDLYNDSFRNPKERSEAANNKDIRLIKTGENGKEMALADFLLTLKVNDDGRNAKEIIDESMTDAPGGPYHVDTRDDKVYLHNRSETFNKTPKNTYYYRTEDSKGDLLSVTTEIDDKAKRYANVAGSSVNDDEKSEQENATHSASPQDFFIVGTRQTLRIIEDGSFVMTQEQRREIEDAANTATTGGMEVFRKKLAQIYIDELMRRYQEDKELALTVLNFPQIQISTSFVNPGYYETTLVGGYEKDKNGNAVFKEENKYVLAQDNLPGGTSGDGSKTDVLYDFTKFISLPIIEDAMKDTVLNISRNNERLSRTADIQIIGDPTIEGRDLIQLKGVAEVHSGLHYIMKCKHQISSSGYTTICSTYQQSFRMEKLLALFRGKEEGGDFELLRFNEREQREFDVIKEKIKKIMAERKALADKVAAIHKRYDSMVKKELTNDTFEEFMEKEIRSVFEADNAKAVAEGRKKGRIISEEEKPTRAEMREDWGEEFTDLEKQGGKSSGLEWWTENIKPADVINRIANKNLGIDP